MTPEAGRLLSAGQPRTARNELSPGGDLIAFTLVRHGRSRLGAVLAGACRWCIPIWAWAVAPLGPVVIVLAAIGTGQALGESGSFCGAARAAGGRSGR